MSRPVTAVVVAAGAGRRLGALGASVSKPMVPVAERPLIAWVIDRLLQAGVSRIIAVVHPDNAGLIDFLTRQHPAIAYASQAERRGMAHALTQALPLLDDAPYLACACDSLFPVDDLRALIDLGRRHPTDAAVGVLAMGVAATASRSAVLVDDERVVAIHEKPAPGTVDTDLVAMPLYWLPRSVDPWLRHDPGPGREWQVAEALGRGLESGLVLRALPVRERLEVTTADDVASVTRALTRDV